MSARTWLAVTAGLYLVLGLGYSLLMPIWEAPDEPAHYNLVVYVTRARGLPPPGHPNYEAGQPPLYYLLASLPLSLVDRVDPSAVTYYQPAAFMENIETRWPVFNWNRGNYRPLWGPWILRLFGLGLGLGSLVLNHLAFRNLLPGQDELIAGATLISGLIPQFLHITASVNNDNLAILAGAGSFYLTVLLATQGWSPRRGLLAAALGLAAPVLIKLTLLPVSVVSLIMVGQAWWKRSRRGFRLSLLQASLALLALGVLVMFFFQSGLLDTLRGELAWRLFTVHPEAGRALSPWNVAINFTMTFWGKIGWVAVGFPLEFNQVLLFLSLAGLVGSLPRLLRGSFHFNVPDRVLALVLALYPVFVLSWLQSGGRQGLTSGALVALPWAALLAYWLRRGWTRERELAAQNRHLAWPAIWAMAALTALTLARNALTSLQMQSRFAFPAMGALAILIAGGWYALLPHRGRQNLPWLTAILLLGLNLYLWLDGVLPVYFQPWF